MHVKYDDSALSGLILCASPSKMSFVGLGRFITGIACRSGFSRKRSNVLQDITDGIYNREFAAEGPRAWTCSDPESRKQFQEMPQCNFRFTMNGANNLIKMMDETYSTKNWKVSHPMMPILFISGLDDPCMGPERRFSAAVTSMRKVGYQNVNVLMYPGMRHEVLNEINKLAVYNQILNFINAH